MRRRPRSRALPHPPLPLARETEIMKLPPRPQGSRHAVAGGGERWRLVAVVWFFVRNASENMVKAGIASGFQFLWRDSGIEVPFNLTGYKPSDTILALLWTGIVNTLLVSAVSIVGGDGHRLHRRTAAAVAQLAAVDPGRRLHRVRPQHPAAVLRAVLVLRRARRPADAARELRASSTLRSSIAAACRSRRPTTSPASGWRCWRRWS